MPSALGIDRTHRPHNAGVVRQGSSSDSPRERNLPMLEQYFVKPATIDRIRGSWIAAEIETYLAWLAGQGYSTKSIWRRIPMAFASASSLAGAARPPSANCP